MLVRTIQLSSTAVSAGLGRVAKKVEQKNALKTQHMLYF